MAIINTSVGLYAKKMRNRELKKYLALLMVISTFFSCQKEKKVEQVQMPNLSGYEEIVYGPVRTVKLLMYNVTNNGDSLIKKDPFMGNTDLDMPTGSRALVKFNKQGLCDKYQSFKDGNGTKGGGVTFEYDDVERLTIRKLYSSYPFGEDNCNRVYEYEYKKLEGYDAIIETEYVPLYNDPYVPAKGRTLSEEVRELHSKLETFHDKYGNSVKSYFTRYQLDDEYPERQNSVVSYSDTTTTQLSYEKDILVSVDDERYKIQYDENGKKYATVDNYKKKTTYLHPNGQPKGFDCSWNGTYEDPVGCSHFFNNEGYFLESARAKAKYSHKDRYGNWTRMLIGHKRPGTILIGEREITYYNK